MGWSGKHTGISEVYTEISIPNHNNTRSQDKKKTQKQQNSLHKRIQNLKLSQFRGKAQTHMH